MTVFVFALLGLVIGGALLGELGGFVFGGIAGAVAGWVADLAGRVRQVEQRLDAQKTAAASRASAATPSAPESEAQRAPPPRRVPDEAPPPVPAAAAPATPPPGDAPPPALGALEPPRAVPEPPRATHEPPPRPAPVAAARAASTARATRAAAVPELETAFDKGIAAVVRWFTTGNIPVKVGVIVSLFGVGFLVKEGIDQEWFTLPIELRLMSVALFGIGLLVLGWRVRERNRTYALSVQGGGIGVLYLTIYASYAIFPLLPAVVTFALLVGVTLAAAALAVLQDARALAVLGIFGGFMAPVLASADTGDHVVLFSYYAVIDLAIVAIAWFKAWRMLNVLGFVFTFLIGTLWGADAYEPELFATTEPFLVLFTLMYLVIPVLFATRSEPRLLGLVDGTLVFGTPIVAFALQSQLVGDTEYGLALSALALAAFYVGLATYLLRLRREELRVLIQAELALGVAFLTVAVPLALDARWTSAAWALQGAALVWLAFRQQRKLALAAGLALQGLSGVAYIVQAPVAAESPILNGHYLGALLIALAGFFSARLLDPRREHPEPTPPLHAALGAPLAAALFLWAGGWWLFGGMTEIERHVEFLELAAVLLFAGATAVVAAPLAARIDWPRLDWLALTLWPIAAIGAVDAVMRLQHPAQELGWLSWPAVVAAMLLVLRSREARFPALRGALHATGYWLVAGLAAWETHWLVARAAGGVWPEAATLAVVAALIFATVRATETRLWPFAPEARTYRLAGCGAVLAALVLATVALNVQSSGDAAPLRYVPLLNPLELVSAFVVLLLLRWFGAVSARSSEVALARQRAGIAAVAAWFLVTLAVGRAVHHWAGVPYELDSLAASTTFQSALSIVWGIAGLAGMIVGTRSARRSVWVVGALLMAVVVAKLFLVDLGNTGTMARVVSFLGVGVLLLVVGYFAPVPPRAEAEPAASH